METCPIVPLKPNIILIFCSVNQINSFPTDKISPKMLPYLLHQLRNFSSKKEELKSLHILNVFTYFPSTQNRRRECSSEFIRIYSVTVRYALMSLNFATFCHSTQYNFVAHELCTLHFQYVSLYVRLSHYSIFK